MKKVYQVGKGTMFALVGTNLIEITEYLPYSCWPINYKFENKKLLNDFICRNGLKEVDWVNIEEIKHYWE